jgi:hypothetical protein
MDKIVLDGLQNVSHKICLSEFGQFNKIDPDLLVAQLTSKSINQVSVSSFLKPSDDITNRCSAKS